MEWERGNCLFIAELFYKKKEDLADARNAMECVHRKDLVKTARSGKKLCPNKRRGIGLKRQLLQLLSCRGNLTSARVLKCPPCLYTLLLRAACRKLGGIVELRGQVLAFTAVPKGAHCALECARTGLPFGPVGRHKVKIRHVSHGLAPDLRCVVS